MKRKGKNVIAVIFKYLSRAQDVIFFCTVVNTVIAPGIQVTKRAFTFPDWVIKYSEFFKIKSFNYWINAAILAFFFIKLIIVVFKKNETKDEELLSIIDSLHKYYFHNMRNHIYQLEETEHLLPKAVHCDINKFERYYNDEYKKLENIAQDCVNQVSEVINDFMGLPRNDKKSICACIKMISIYEKNKPIAKRSLITLARSQNSSHKRIQKNKKDIIGENTDFLDLSEGFRNYYYGVGLREKYKKGEYANSTIDFSYESTIVVPIRYTSLKREIKRNKKQIEINVKNDVDIVGYLCIDTEKKLTDWENNAEVKNIVKILALYADTLYIYLSAFRRTFEKQI